MTPHDRESAAALVERIERDGEWHVAAWTIIVDSDSERIAGVTGHLTSAAQDEQNAADIVEARRLLPVMQREIERLTRERDEARAEAVAADERMAAVLDGTFSVGDGTAQREIERLRTRLEAVDPEEREPAEEPLASLSSRDEKCECCGGVIHAGTDLAAFVGGDGRQVFAHWGPCPEPDQWAAEWDLPTPTRAIRRREVFETFEEAWVRALRMRGNGPPRRTITNIRLLRIRSRCTAPIDRPVPDGVECTYRQEPCGRPAVGERCERHGGER